ncbi:MAG: SRPBCC family protein [Flavobacteriales bacterium]|nr:SRPBCC family protein [Flavobacteriales bacterium]
MRALKTILIIVVALVVLIAVLAMFGDSRFRVERTIVVAAPAAAVYANISSLEAMDKWGPWKEMEHNMTATMSGSPDGEVGAISHWKSDESEGEQELAELVPNERMRTKLRFISPWKANNEGTFDLVAMGDSTKVTWGIQGENDFMGRVVALFMDMDKAVGPMLEKGLANLKSITESEYAEVTPEYEIQTIDRPAMLYVGKRKVVGWADMKAFYGQQFGESMAAIGKAGVAPAGVPSGVYFEWNEEKKTADMLAGIPVPMDAKKKLKDLSLYETPAGRALLIEYYGGYSGLGPAHEAMDAYMKANKLEFNVNVVEEYLTDPGSEPDSSRWRTNVIYLIK